MEQTVLKNLLRPRGRMGQKEGVPEPPGLWWRREAAVMAHWPRLPPDVLVAAAHR